MQYKFNKHIESLLPASDTHFKILVAVSGGADSMCLLDLLHNSNLDISIAAAHVNFHLRGEESCKDEKLVRDYAAENDIKLFVKEFDTISYAKEHSLSVEMAARELRYDWFEQLRSGHGFDYIAVAHHANDNAETLILNLLRGTGINGICGMKEIDHNRRLLRPLLSYSRQEIEQYAAKKGIPYRTDHTNLECEYYRNRIRNIIMPQLQHINPSVVATLNRNMHYFSQAAEMVNDLLEQKSSQLKRTDCNTGSFFLGCVKSLQAREYIVSALAEYMECHISIEELLQYKYWRYLLYDILCGYSFNSAQMEDFIAALAQRESKRIVSKSHIAVQERGFVKVYKNTLPGPFESVVIEDFEGMKEIVFGNRVLRMIKMPVGKGEESVGMIKKDYPLTLMMDAGLVSFPLTLQALEQGARWIPFGMIGKKKLSDYLMDLKIDTVLKPGIPVLYNSPGNIVSLPGLQISNLYRVTKSTKQLLILSLI